MDTNLKPKNMKGNILAFSQNEIESTTIEEDMTLSPDSASIIFQMFSKNIYSNPIGSVVREITSNCFDSHVEANQMDIPVLIKRSKDLQTNTEYISFIDFGVGMSPDRINNVYRKYFTSTKRLDNNQIGYFGLGSKSILAYKRSTGFGDGEYDNSFTVITNFDGTKYIYQIYEGKSCPRIAKLHEEPTTERNGTEVKVPVLQKDIQRFEQEIVKQLYYFENIVFEGFDKSTLNNEYQIFQGKEFLYRGEEVSNYMHVCLGRVAYPIDYNVLGLNSADYNVPIALRLNVGDINVTVSRESLDYNEGTIKFLKKKLEACKQELIDMLIKQYDNIVGLKEYFEYKNNFGNLMIGTKNVSINKIIKAKDVALTNFKYANLPVLDSSALFRIFFTTKMFGKKESKDDWRNRNAKDVQYFNKNYDGLSKVNNLYFNDGDLELKRTKQAWLKTQHSRYYVIIKSNKFLLEDINGMLDSTIKYSASLANLTDVNGKPTATGELFLEAQEEYYEIVRKHSVDYQSIEVPEDFILNRKRDTLSDEIKNSTIPITYISGNYLYKERTKLIDLFNYKSIIYYGTNDDIGLIRNSVKMFNMLFNVNYHSRYRNHNSNKGNCWEGFDGKPRANGKRSGKRGILFIILAKNNVQYMEYCRNAHHISEFKTKMVHRKSDQVMANYQTYDLLNNYSKLDSLYKSDLIKVLSPKYGKKLEAIKSYIKSLPKSITESSSNFNNDKEILEMFYDFSQIVLTKDQQEISKKINDMNNLADTNSNVLNYINLPYSYNNYNTGLVEILKKVMDFS